MPTGTRPPADGRLRTTGSTHSRSPWLLPRRALGRRSCPSSQIPAGRVGRCRQALGIRKKWGARWGAPEEPQRRRKRLFDALAVQAEVEALALLLLGDAKAHDHVDHLEQDEAANAADDQRRRHGAELHEEVAVGAADRLDVERTGEERPDDAADAVHAEGVERIVVAQRALDRRRGEEADDARG